MTFSSRCRLLASALPLVFGATLIFAADAPQSKAPPRTIYDVTLLLAQYKPDLSKIEQARAKIAQLPPTDADNATLFRFYFERARAADQVGNARLRLADYRKAREYARGDLDTWWTLDGLAAAENYVGNLLNVVEIRKEALKVSKGPSRAIHNYAPLISNYISLGDIDAARKTLAQLERTMQSLTNGKTSGWFNDTYLSRTEQGRGLLSYSTGKYALAEAQFRKSIAALEAYIELTPNIPSSAGRTGAISGHKQRREGLLNWLARSQTAQGHYADAEVTLREALKSALSERGPNDVMAQSIAIHMASLLNQAGRFRESELVTRNALRVLEDIGVTPEATTHLFARAILTDALTGQRNWKLALDNHDAAMVGLSGDPVLAERFQKGNRSLV